jgi:hypothetical protein
MNWDQIAGNWKQFKGHVKERWGIHRQLFPRSCGRLLQEVERSTGVPAG